MTSEPTDRIFTIPNLITLARLLLVPVAVMLLVHYQNNVAAFLVFGIAAATDFLDGLVARSTGQVSKLGQQFDPLVDRILIIAGVIAVFAVGRVPLWILILLIARDLAMLGLTVHMLRVYQRQFRVIFSGKVATALIMTGFSLLMLNAPQIPGVGLLGGDLFPGWGSESASLGIWLLYFGLLVSLPTAAVYFYQGTRPEAGSAGDSAADAHGGSHGGSHGGGYGGSHGASHGVAVGRHTAQTHRRAPLDDKKQSRKANASARDRLAASLHTLPDERSTAGQRATLGIRETRNWSTTSSRGATGSHAPVGSRSATGSHVPVGSRSATGAHAPVGARQATGGRLTGATGSWSASGGHPAGSTWTSSTPLFLRILNTRTKLLAALLVAVSLVTGICFYSFDTARNWESIHPGVHVADIDLSYLTHDEAVALLSSVLTQRANLLPVDLFASQSALDAGIGEQTVHLEAGVGTYDSNQPDAQTSSWRVSASSLGLSVDAVALADKAFAVGRGADFLLGRVVASFFGVHLDAPFDYSDNQRVMLEENITKAIGTPLVNSNFIFQGGGFRPVQGVDGYIVDSAALTKQLNAAFLGGEHQLVVPMVDKAQEVSLDDAAAVAAKTETQTASVVYLTFEKQSFSVSSDILRSWIGTTFEHSSDKSSTTLVATFDPQKIKDGIQSVIGDLNPGIVPVEASFTVIQGALSVVPGEQGLGVDFTTLAAELDSLLLGADAAGSDSSSGAATGNSVPIPIGPLDPALTTEKAESYDFPEAIAEFTTYYWGSTATRTNNVHKAAEYANSSIIAPGDIWSFNERVGECSLERGFEVDKAIVGDTYEDAIGGGVCQVASTIFNAAYDAGLPIIERSNHAIYMGSYPDGRDAAIAWPYADLSFKNDTKATLLLTLTYDDTSVTAILWGINPGYRVQSVPGDWEEGEHFSTKETRNPDLGEGQKLVKIEGKDGRSITVVRTVYNADGTKRSESSFRSVYNARTEVVELGPDPKPEPPSAVNEPPANAANNPPASASGDPPASASSGSGAQ